MRFKKGCQVCGNKIESKGYCVKHYQQIKKHGKILQRTMYDKNKIIDKENYNIIITYNKQGNENGQVIIDKDDKEYLSKFKWCIGSNGYPQTMIDRKPKRMHELLLEKNIQMVCDHINRNKLDNRKQNLRLVSQTINCLNRKTNNISFHKASKLWRVYCSIKGKYLYHQYTKTFDEAERLKDKLELQYLNGIKYNEEKNN